MHFYGPIGEQINHVDTLVAHFDKDMNMQVMKADKITQEKKEDGMTALQLLADNLIKQLQQLPASCAYKMHSIARLQTLDIENIAHLCAQGNRLTNMDKRYILCFAAGMSVEDVADLFHIEPASVYTVRYRLRKKFPAAIFPY